MSEKSTTETVNTEKYLPLYRKYRPSTFSEVVGQETVVTTLQNAVKTGRIPHAYLFSGPRGTGKTSIARIFAKTLNCLNLKDSTPCGVCEHCLDMKNSVSLDVIEIDAASNRKVEDARNLLEKVQYVPVLGKHKIYIIDEVHMLTTEAFNTLLKTLEEPPQNLIFILATTEPHKVLETIISRCQRFDFRRIQNEDIFNRLKEISKIEKFDIEDEALHLIAKKAQGGLRDALALLDQTSILALNGEKIKVQDVNSLLGAVSDEELTQIAKFIAEKDPNLLVELVHKTLKNGNEPTSLMKEVISYFRDLMLVKVCTDVEKASEITDLTKDNVRKLKEISNLFEIQELTQIIEKLYTHEINIKRSTNPYLLLDVALISICTREDINTIKSLSERIEALEAGGVVSNIPRNINIPTPVVQTAKPAVQELPQPKIEEKSAEIKEKTIVEENIEAVDEVSIETLKKTNSETAKEEIEEPKQEPVQELTKQEIKLGAEGERPVAPKGPDPTSGNWALVLSNIESIPTKTLFQSLAKPVKVTSDLVEITFAVETFVKQANEPMKLKPLQAACAKVFGTLPSIVIRSSKTDTQKKNPNREELTKASSEPIKTFSKPIERTQPAKIEEEPAVRVIEENYEVEDEPKIEEISQTKPTNTKESEKAKNTYIGLSDQANNVVNIFAAKIID